MIILIINTPLYVYLKSHETIVFIHIIHIHFLSWASQYRTGATPLINHISYQNSSITNNFFYVQYRSVPSKERLRTVPVPYESLVKENCIDYGLTVIENIATVQYR